MRIGILTFHRSINYGAFMQAYALSNEIRRRFGDIVEIIDFEKLSKNLNYKKPLYGLKNYIIHGNEYWRKYRKFRKDLDLLPLSRDTLITDDYVKVLDYINGRYDIVIVGSDAVWAYNKGLGIRNPYWLFGDKLHCIKMSYAASAYSLDIVNVPNEDKNYIAECLQSFSYIGVRDTETYKFIKSVNEKLDIHMNCDPTVLLRTPNNDFGKLVLEKKFGIDGRKKIISIMLGTKNYYLNDIIRKLGKQQFEFVYLYNRADWKDRYKFSSDKFLYNLSPYEWYQVYSCFYLNITTYFHGTLLALKGNVPTLSFDETKFSYNYISKIKQVLTDLNLSEYWFDNNVHTKEQKDIVLDRIDYILNNHDQITEHIANNMIIEKEKSNSFFSKLSILLNK